MVTTCELYDAIVAHFQQQRSRVAAFASRGRQMEQWFVGELMAVLDGLGLDWSSAAAYEAACRRYCDLVVDLADGRLGIEVKAAFVGQQFTRRMQDGGCVGAANAQGWRPESYAVTGSGKPQGIVEDLERLRRQRGLRYRWAVAFVYGPQQPNLKKWAGWPQEMDKLVMRVRSRFGARPSASTDVVGIACKQQAIPVPRPQPCGHDLAEPAPQQAGEFMLYVLVLQLTPGSGTIPGEAPAVPARRSEP